MPYLNEDDKTLMDHACKINHMLVLSKFNIFIIQLFLQTNSYAITISSLQDACLEHAVVLVTSKFCKKLSSLHFPIFKNI
jgi:hypothetical protein